jgi:DNA-binding transcriptional regulator GbsR (MarR family)
MKVSEAKARFVQIWGTVGVEWGINKTMAQLHGLLLASERDLTTEDVMSQLKISRGNANMNLRELISWGLIYRESQVGERKEYFRAEKDMWAVAQKIAAERKRRELDPMIKLLVDLQKEIEPTSSQNAEVRAFSKLLSEIVSLSKYGDQIISLLLRVDQNKFLGPFIKLFKK